MSDEIPEIENTGEPANVAAEVEPVAADATTDTDAVIEPQPETLVLRPGPVVPDVEPKKTNAEKAAAKDAAAGVVAAVFDCQG